MFKLWITTVALLPLLTGCGGGNTSTPSDEIVQERQAKNYFGYLADATVKLYALDGIEKRLLFTEKTTSGDGLEAIGNFDPHLREMQREVEYLYEVSGGDNWDADKDGEMDSHPTQNRKVFRTVYKNYRPKVAWWSTSSNGNTMAPSER